MIPDNNAYTGSGRVSSILLTPRESPYIAAAPGSVQRKKTKKAGMSPACIWAIAKSILVEAGPGKAEI